MNIALELAFKHFKSFFDYKMNYRQTVLKFSPNQTPNNFNSTIDFSLNTIKFIAPYN